MNAFSRFASRWFGRGSADIHERAEAVTAKAVDLSTAFRPLRVTKRIEETHDSVVLWLEDPSGAPLTFQSGQFLSFSVETPEGRLTRSYSICSAPHSGEVAIGVKRVLGGRVSNYLNDHAQVGSVLLARGPSGRFVLPQSKGARRVFLIAGGSGITPLLSHARTLLQEEPESQVVLLYGNRSEASVMFKNELALLAQQYSERLVLRHALSDPLGELSCVRGMLDAETLRGEFAKLSLRPDVDGPYLLCGPEPMMDAALSVLSELGVARERILEERFTQAVASLPSERQEASGPLPMTIRIRGEEKRLTVTPGETLLDAAMRQHVVLDFSCATGACGTCMARLVEGEVELDEPHCLSERERAQGMILPCISRCRSACILETI